MIEESSDQVDEGDFFKKHRKYTVALSLFSFSVAILLAAGSVAIYIVREEIHGWLLLCAFVPAAIGGWLRNRSRGIREEYLRNHDAPVPDFDGF